MAITFVGAGAIAVNATLATQSISSHANTAIGDILIAQVFNRSTGANTISAPDATWTQIGTQTTNSGGILSAAFWKRATAAGAQAFTFTKQTDDNLLFGGVISAWRGNSGFASPIDLTAPVFQTTTGAADNVTFAAFDPTSTSAHVVFMAYYAEDATTFAAAMSNDVNPDCTTRYDLESSTGTDGSVACTSGDNDGSNVASRTWASAATTDAANTGLVFALVTGDPINQRVLGPPAEARAASRHQAIFAQPLGRNTLYLAEPEEEVEYVLGAPVEGRFWRLSALAALSAQPLGAFQPNLEFVAPFRQIDWVNPRPLERRPTAFEQGFRVQDQEVEEPEEFTLGSPIEQWIARLSRAVAIAAQPLGIRPPAVAEAPIRSIDWPNPRLPTHAARGWIDQTKINLIGQDRLPENQLDWPNPRGRIPATSLKTWTYQALAATVRPFNQLSWPNPRGAIPATSLKTWIDNAKILIGQDQFFGLAGHPNFDWPNPRAASRQPQDWQQGFRLLDQAAQFPARNTNYDWPNPKGPIYPVSLRTWTDQTRRQLIGQDQLPHRQTQWPVPLGAPRRPHQHTWLNWINISFAVAKPFSQTNWPNPLGKVGRPDWTSSFDLTLTTHRPHAQRDWPNPRGPERRPDEFAWLSHLNLALLLTRPFQQTDWPNPRGETPAISLGTWLDRTRINLIGQDKFFGLAGHPNFDWPNPTLPLPTIGLYTWTQQFNIQQQVGADQFITPDFLIDPDELFEPTLQMIRSGTPLGPEQPIPSRYNRQASTRSNIQTSVRTPSHGGRRPRERG